MTDAESSVRPAPPPLPILRSALGGILMGLANLVPGISGGTMILVVGLYNEFITALADVTRLRFSKRSVIFLAIVAGGAAIAILTLAGTLSRAVTLHRSAMFSLFIGLTLGGAPLLMRMLKRFDRSSGIGLLLGLGIMTTLAATNPPRPQEAPFKEAVVSGEFVIEPSYGRDLAAGALGMSAMVLPGISGAYMFLILGRYEAILASIDAAKEVATSWSQPGGETAFLHVLIPVGLGAGLGLVLLSNLLKWVLHRHQKVTVAILLGILIGSVIGIWPFDATATAGDYVLGASLAAAGFATTMLLSRLNA
ncbi:MAG: DUF368 domain-containing protein [Planctomycetes bacterium]|nr:DUF368 domain-containing protein [Planctomycetota bacterium]